MTKRFAACREKDAAGNWIVHAVVSDDGKGLPDGWHCMELSGGHADKRHEDFPLPGDVWNEKGRVFEKRSDQRAALIAEQASGWRARI